MAEHAPDAVSVLIPLREDASRAREAQLRALCARLLADGVLASGSRVIVAEQADDGLLFNRGGLLNAAFAVARERGAPRALILHDVDLLPDAGFARAFYHAPFDGGVHLAAAWRGRYDGDARYAGGVLALDAATFEHVNGYPNSYFGWGGEDEALRRRLERAGCTIARTGPRAWTDPSGRGARAYEDLERLGLAQKLRVLREAGAKLVDKYERRAICEATQWDDGVSTLARDIAIEGGGGGGDAQVWRVVVRFATPPTDLRALNLCDGEHGERGGPRERERGREAPGQGRLLEHDDARARGDPRDERHDGSAEVFRRRRRRRHDGDRKRQRDEAGDVGDGGSGSGSGGGSHR